MSKLIVFDLDGTLLDSQSIISKVSKDYLISIQESGVMLSICTGRASVASKKFAKELNINGPIITDGGAMICDIKDQIYYYSPIKMVKAERIIKYCHEKNIKCSMFFRNNIYTNSLNSITYYVHETFDHITPTFFKNLEKVLIEEPLRIAIISDSNINSLYLELNKQFHSDYYVVKSTDNIIDIFEKNTSKGKTINVLIKSLGLDNKDVIAFGDSYNDIDMIENCGIGVAMGNAKIDLKSKADFITLSNDENGIVYFLKNHLNFAIQ